jgi:hypothetical protein
LEFLVVEIWLPERGIHAKALTAKDFLLFTNLLSFSLVAQALKFAGLSDATSTGMSVAKLTIARLNSGATKK